ncbi:MAG: c-type cytochrome [Fidelibacterota bacterium]
MNSLRNVSFLAIGAVLTTIISCTTAPESTAAPAPVKTEADPPLQMGEALKNIDMGMKMMGNMEQMKQMVMKAQNDAIAYGEKLFNDPSLSGAKRGVACVDCHPGGGSTGGEAEIPPMMGFQGWKIPIPDLHGSAATFPKFKVPNASVISLAQMNNNCVAMFVGGERLPLNGKESHALALYVTSLSKGVAVEPGKMGGM